MDWQNWQAFTFWREWSQLGYNITTVGLLGTVFFTFLEAWGMWEQNTTIWRQKSGLSISVIWMSNSTALFASVLIYGLSSRSFALFFNGFLLLFHFPVMLGLWRFRGFTRIEKLLAILFLAIVIAALMLPIKDWAFFFFSIGSLLFSVMLPIEIWRNKNSGAVEIKLLAVLLASTIFWLIYAYTSGDWVLKINTPAYMVTFATSIILWFKYRQPKTINSAP